MLPFNPARFQNRAALDPVWGTLAHLTNPPLYDLNFEDLASVLANGSNEIGGITSTGASTANPTQGTQANKPILQSTSNVNSRYAARFDGSNDFLSAGTNGLAGIPILDVTPALSVNTAIRFEFAGGGYNTTGLTAMSTASLIHGAFLTNQLEVFQNAVSKGSQAISPTITAAGELWLLFSMAGLGGGNFGRIWNKDGVGNRPALDRAFNGDWARGVAFTATQSAFERDYTAAVILWEKGMQSLLPGGNAFASRRPLRSDAP